MIRTSSVRRSRWSSTNATARVASAGVEAVEVERAGALRRVERREVGRYPVRGEGRRDGVDALKRRREL